MDESFLGIGKKILYMFLSLLIFQQMERFRIVEKETKTKAYSKEGRVKVQPLQYFLLVYFLFLIMYVYI